MLNRYQQVIGGVFRITDAGVVALVWLASYWARFFLPPFEVRGELPAFSVYASLVPLIAILWMLVFSVMGVYESGRLRGRKQEVLLMWRAHAVALALFLALTYAYDHYRYSRLVMAYFGVSSACVLAVLRISLRTLLRWARARGYNLRHVLVVGEAETMARVVERIDWYPELGLRVRGLVTRNGSPPSNPSEHLRTKPVVGSYAELPALLAQGGVDEVLLALPRSEQGELASLLESLRDETVDIRVLPDVQEYVTFGCRLEHIDGVPIMRINDSPVFGWGSLLKRAIDVCASAVALVVLMPLLLAISLGVKLTSPGPILYRQERMGLDGRTFWMLKVRSMRIDAERDSGAVWAVPHDTRRTAFGTFLRKTSLDELPQLWNVLAGDMSLVGPRPERPVFVSRFRHEIPHYMLRHKVKAGLTGWAQVNGWRGDTSLKNRIDCDLYYIQNWSIALDIKIVFLTLWKGFVNKNAY
jgi:Undecaprenyl-phosphate glucose phosphotransferase